MTGDWRRTAAWSISLPLFPGDFHGLSLRFCYAARVGAGLREDMITNPMSPLLGADFNSLLPSAALPSTHLNVLFQTGRVDHSNRVAARVDRFITGLIELQHVLLSKRDVSLGANRRDMVLVVRANAEGLI